MIKASKGVMPLTAALVLVLLTACASAPAPLASAAQGSAPAAASWQAPLPHGGATADLSSWWQQFNDPALPALQAAAQAASPTLASARARIERARAARAAAGAALLPQVDAMASASSGRSTPGQPTVSSASLGLQAAWELDLFGGVAAGRNAAQARLFGAQAGWHDARVAVAAEVASTVLALRACEAQAVQTRADATSRNETARLTGLSESAGFTAPADTALARAGAAQSRNLAVSQQAGCDTLVKSLVEITGLAEPELRQRLADGTARVPQPAAIAVTVLPASLLSQRPDLADAARAVEAAAADAAQSRAHEMPRVSLSGSFAGTALRSGGTGQGTSQGATWSLGPLVVSLPLFDGGARSAATASARASYDEAVALYQAQLRRAVREVETALVALQSAGQRQADADSAARDFEASLRATQARQQGGLASLFDLEAARRNAVQAQSALIDLQREQAAAWIALYRALGGGWNAADPGPNLGVAAKP